MAIRPAPLDTAVDLLVRPAPRPTRARTVARSAGLWGAGPDGARLAWGGTPTQVYRLGTPGAEIRHRAPEPQSPRPTTPEPARRPAPADDAELAAFLVRATDLGADLLTHPVPGPRRRSPVRTLLARLRRGIRQAGSWGAGPDGERLA